MTTDQKIQALRQAMRREGITAYLIPSSDPHQSEYVADHWKCREWLSGFTGSAGILVVTEDHAGLWTDSRYFLQAEKELAGTCITLQKQVVPHAPEHVNWLADNLAPGSIVGLDGRLFSLGQVRHLAKHFYSKNIEILADIDLVAPIWTDRPAMPLDPEFLQRGNDPALQITDILFNIRKFLTLLKVKHHINHALPRPVIGVLAAPPGLENRETRVQQIGVLRAGPGGIESRVLQQPDHIPRPPFMDRGHALIHERQGLFVIDRFGADFPFHPGFLHAPPPIVERPHGICRSAMIMRLARPNMIWYSVPAIQRRIILRRKLRFSRTVSQNTEGYLRNGSAEKRNLQTKRRRLCGHGGMVDAYA